MKIKGKLLTLIVVGVLALSAFVIAEDPPKPILKSGDVVHFIKTFPLLTKDLKDFGARYEAREGDITIPEALKVNEKFLAVLKKHGWDEHFFQKTGTIFLGYSSILYGKGIKEAETGLDKSLKEIESNPHLSAAMKEQLKSQLKAAQGAMKAQENVFHQKIHVKDLALIRPHLKELKKVMEEESK